MVHHPQVLYALLRTHQRGLIAMTQKSARRSLDQPVCKFDADNGDAVIRPDLSIGRE